MEAGVLLYELDPPFIYEDLIFISYYILGAESHVCLYILRDKPFTHLIDSLDFNLDQLYDFSISWLHPNGHDYSFSGPPIHTQPLHQVTPEPDAGE
ncbi:hypothetical protein AHAS_Ahas03G0172000 [Arachis hypogaea]